MILETERLILRCWEQRDIAPFAAINADPEVMRYFPSELSFDQTTEMVNRMKVREAQKGFGFCPVELRASGEMIGMVGLNIPGYPLPFDPCVEVGWRLARSTWGKGYASEAARAWINWGFETGVADQIVSFTPQQNLPSQKVMERLGMTRDMTGDFDHPMLAADHSLLSHQLFRLNRP